MPNEAVSRGPRLGANELLLGLTLALTIAYVPVTLGAMLAKTGLEFGTVVFGTAVSMGVGCLASGLFTRTPFVVAPALGMAGIVVSASASPYFDGPQALQSCIVGGFLVFLLSIEGRPSWRKRALDSIPVEIKLGIQAGVGVVLLVAAERLVRESIGPVGAEPTADESLRAKQTWTLFALAVIAIVLSNVITERIERAAVVDRLPLRKKVTYVLMKGMPIVTTIVLAIVWVLFYDGSAPRAMSYSSWPSHRLFALPGSLESAMMSVHITIVAAFLLLTDIPGTPYALFPQANNDEGAVERSFKIDSTLAIINGVLGTAPSVYYAENNITRYFKRTGGAPAMLVGIIFLAVAGVILLSGHAEALLALLPAVAVAPLVAFIGITVVAHSVIQKPSADVTSEQHPPRRYWFYMPTAIMIFLTPMIGLQFSLPVGIIVYWLYGLVDKRRSASPIFVAISMVAVLVVVLRALLWFYEPT